MMEKRGAAVLVLDDEEIGRATLAARLELLGYRVHPASSGAQALDLLGQRAISLVLFNAEVADLNGEQLLERRRADANLSQIPFLVIADAANTSAVAKYLQLGAEDYIARPFDTELLEARVGGSLERRRLREIERKYQALFQADPNGKESAPRAGPFSGPLARIRKFVSPQLAELIISASDEHALESHRREITVAFCDLRGFTAFTDTAEPEDVMGVLRDYHKVMGEVILEHQGVLERFAGDGMMIFFNDPIEIPDPAGAAVRMSIAMREQAQVLETIWRDRGYDLAMGMGVSMGYATCGRIGFEGRYDYGAIGSVTNMAARLCDQAKAGQILINRRVRTAVEGVALLDEAVSLTLKGFSRPVEAFNVIGLK